MATDLVVYRAPSPQPGQVRFEGSTSHDHEQLIQLPSGTDMKIVVTVPRSLKYHKMFFAMLKIGLDYMDESDRLRLNIHTTEELLNRLKLDLGLYDLTILAQDAAGLPAGTALYRPRSISFAKMDQTQFKDFFRGCLGVLIQKYVRNQTEDSLDEAVNHLLRFD